MKRRTPRLCLAAVLLSGSILAQGKGLKIGAATGRHAVLPITLTSDGDVQGFVLSVAIDEDRLVVTDVRGAGAAIDNAAELVVSEILPEGFTLSVVMDFEPPFEGQVIPAGSDHLIAEAAVAASFVLSCGEEQTLPIEFRDGLSTPPVSNVVVVDSTSFGRKDGLELQNGSLTVLGACNAMRVVSAAGENLVPVTISVDNDQAVEGYVIAVSHPAEIGLDRISTAGTDASAVGIEFEVSTIHPDGGTLAVIFDFEGPYDGHALTPGENQTLAAYTYSHPPFTCDGECTLEFPIAFADDRLGSPPLANVFVQDGFSASPELIGGTVTFLPHTASGSEEIAFWTGGEHAEPSDGVCGEPPEFEIPCAAGRAGSEAKVRLYYTSVKEPIQGISMAIVFPAELAVNDLEPSGQGAVSHRHLDGTITEGIAAEFVSFNADNEAGELIVGILVDSIPPMPVNHMYPTRDCPGSVLNVFFQIPEDAACDTRYVLAFQDGITGAGDVPISNRAAVFNDSRPVAKHSGCIVVRGKAAFIRGDCNTDAEMDIADAAATIGYLIAGRYDPRCLDACDANDDEVVDLADACAMLRYLFKSGPQPPAPFPEPGFDVTPGPGGSDLGCEWGDPCTGG